MKIAFCIAGQLRNFDESFKSYLKFIEKHDCTVFISTWLETGNKQAGYIFYDQLKQLLEDRESVMLFPAELLKNNFWTTFPEFSTLHNPTTKVNNEFLKRYFENAEIDIEDESKLSLNFKQQVQDKNSLRILYKYWKVNEMKRKYEETHNIIFDLVIRVRPDLIIKDILPFNSIGKGDIYVAHTDKDINKHINDIYAISRSYEMDKLNEFFGKAIHSQNNWKGIHPEIANFITSASLKPIETKFHNGFSTQSKISSKNLVDHIKVSNNKTIIQLKNSLELLNASKSGKPLSNLSEILKNSNDYKNCIHFLLAIALYYCRYNASIYLNIIGLINYLINLIQDDSHYLMHSINMDILNSDLVYNNIRKCTIDINIIGNESQFLKDFILKVLNHFSLTLKDLDKPIDVKYSKKRLHFWNLLIRKTRFKENWEDLSRIFDECKLYFNYDDFTTEMKVFHSHYIFSKNKELGLNEAKKIAIECNFNKHSMISWANLLIRSNKTDSICVKKLKSLYTEDDYVLKLLSQLIKYEKLNY